VDKLVSDFGDKHQYETLQGNIADAEAAYKAAAAKIVRQSVKA
jgi:hypothetical protein